MATRIPYRPRSFVCETKSRPLAFIRSSAAMLAALLPASLNADAASYFTATSTSIKCASIPKIAAERVRSD